ncbi:MAG: hypothetical protein IJ806_11885 [Ruminococcus sp.]|nr:hypothetical protein [Ruminococcus sp.]
MLTDKELINALSAADEALLTGLANKGIYKRACKDTEGVSADFTEKDGCAELTVGGERVTVKVPLGESLCSCPSRTVCRHIIGAVLILREQLPADLSGEVREGTPPQPVPQPEQQPVPEPEEPPAARTVLSPRELREVRETAGVCMGLLGDIAARGLVRLPDSAPADLEIAAVKCHAARMADAERAVRDISGRLEDCLNRRASFSTEVFAEKLAGCYGLLERLDRADLWEDDLGSFRREYKEVPGTLTLLPVGMRHHWGTEHQGEIYYFLDTDSGRFLTFSDLRPVFYDTVKTRRQTRAMPWGLSVPLRSMMKTKMTLSGARLSGSKLSSSQETAVLSQGKADLNCTAVHRAVTYDLRKIAAELYGKTDNEERLYIIHPESCEKSTFDRYSQEFVMSITDCMKNTVRVKAQYREETKDFIRELESVTGHMTDNSDKFYTMLVSARIEDGELVLFPIEVYDFIEPPEPEHYTLPDRFAEMADEGGYAEELLRVLGRIEEEMSSMVRCGLSGAGGDKGLTKLCRSCGMTGLARFTEELERAAGSYRHSMEGSAEEVLKRMDTLYRYIRTARSRLSTAAALIRMGGS